MDHPEMKVMGETMIIKELVPLIDKNFRTVKKREGRSICGFSMGGGGSIRLALKYPNLFSAAASWAAAMRFKAGHEDPAAIAKLNANRIRGRVRLLFVVGDQDLTYASHKPVLQALDELKIPYSLHKLNGVDHNLGMYYKLTGEELVKFVAAFVSAKR